MFASRERVELSCDPYDPVHGGDDVGKVETQDERVEHLMRLSEETGLLGGNSEVGLVSEGGGVGEAALSSISQIEVSHQRDLLG